MGKPKNQCPNGQCYVVKKAGKWVCDICGRVW